MPPALFLRKPSERPDPETAGEPRLQRALSPLTLTSLGLGGIIGTGIFVMIGIAAHDKTGPALALSFLVAAIACAAVALCYAEFAASVPEAGSAYSYAYATLGELPAWLIGWNLIFAYGIGAASVAQGWSHYFQDFLGGLGLTLPRALASTPYDLAPQMGKLVPTGSLGDLPALLITEVISFCILRGMRASLRFNFAMLSLKLAILFFVIGVGAFYIKPQNWHPFAPYGLLAQAGPGGQPLGMMAGAALVFYAYLGFEALSAYTEECRKPQRDVPLGILASVALCTLLYIAVAVVLTGIVPYDRINVRAPISDAFGQVGLPWAQFLIALGALTGITSVLLVILLTLPRILMVMGRDGLLPPGVFSAIHPRYRTPWKATIVIGVAAGLLSALVPLRILADLVMMATLLGYVVICIAVLILRRTHAHTTRRFRAPLGPFVPLLGILTCLLLIRSLPSSAWLQLFAWLLLGLGVYFAYGRRHSVLARSHPATEPVGGLAAAEEGALR
ncbi:MAG TPA: amino acid permease [Chthonomonadaceae bacterium]|nr:amino acid permease [Chthonomonadaceae bacterium]